MAKGKTTLDAFSAALDDAKHKGPGRRKMYRPYKTFNKTFRIRDYLEKPLAQAAFYEGVTQSEVICLALEKYLKVKKEN